MTVFCRKDQQCICNLCITNKHKNHDVVLIGEEVPEKKLKLVKMQRQTTKMIQTREKEEQGLKQAIKSFKTSAIKAVEENEMNFTELIRSIEMMQCAVKEGILAQEEAMVKKVNTLLQRLEQEISDLKSRDAELQHLEQLSQAENDVYFLQMQSTLLWIQIQCMTIFQLSNLNKELTAVHTSANYPSHPDRFERRVQALCREGLRGSPRYWEVECGTKGSWVNIAVSYKEMKRKGKQAPLFGRCKSSWALRNYGDVECSACTGRKRKAEKTCLQCLASYCENHLDIHNDLHTNAKRHKLVMATGRLEERICPEHDKLMEVFCRTDKQCICHMCITQKHRAHDVVSIDYEVAEVKLKLAKTQREITDRINSRESDMQALQQAIEDFQASARQAVEENEKRFTELIHTIELRQGVVKKLILDQEEEAVKKATELLERLPSEITDLKRRDFELQRLEQLSQADNGVYFLQGILSTPALSSSLPSPVLFVHPYSSFQLATEAVLDLIKQMNHVCNLHFTNILKHDASKLTLNPDTAHFSLRLSKENKEVTAVHQAQDYGSHPDRFDCRAQILCKERLQGTPQYWEVEYTANVWVCIAVSYTGIYRKGKKGCLFGRNRCSWGLRCYSTSFQFWHDDNCIAVKYNKRCPRIGVYLDHGIGILEFYNVCDDMSLIYKAQTNFTEPVYAGFGLAGKGGHIKLCDLEEEAMSD
ncbi:hypothetical protein QTP86_027356 [Hemibagrus guttatus]|nr:hypothetical protein QTP86_027356 [Hemibagrus guttatus]